MKQDTNVVIYEQQQDSASVNEIENLKILLKTAGKKALQAA